MTRTLTVLATALLALLLPAGPALAHNNTGGHLVPFEVTTSETSPKWDLAIWLTWAHADIRDMPSTFLLADHGRGGDRSASQQPNAAA